MTVVPDGNDLQIRSLKQFLLLRGRSVKQLLTDALPLLDGVHSVDELQALLADRPGLQKVLAVLLQAGLVEDASLKSFVPESEPLKRIDAFFAGLGADPESTKNVSTARVLTISDAATASALSQRFCSLGLTNNTCFSVNNKDDLVAAGLMATDQDQHETRVSRFGEVLAGHDLVVFATRAWNPAVPITVNETCLRAGVPWLGLQAVSEAEFVLGPAVIPQQQGACYYCAESRRRSNWLEVAAREAAYDSHAASSSAVDFTNRIPQPLWDSALDLFAVEALKLVSGNTFFSQTINQVIRYRPFMAELEHHRILRLPRCPHCSLANGRPPVRAWME